MANQVLPLVVFTNKAKLGTVKTKKGQILFVKDSKKVYVDIDDTTRLGISDQSVADAKAAMTGTSGATFSGNITAPRGIFTSTADASGTAAGTPPLIVGNATGAHIEVDSNEIMAKTNGTSVAALFINTDGGNVTIGNASSTVIISGTLSAPVATASKNGLMSAHDKGWFDSRFQRHVYGADTNATNNYGYYKVASLSITGAYSTRALKLRIVSDNFTNYFATPVELMLYVRSNAANANPPINVFAYADMAGMTSGLLNNLYLKYTSTANTGGICELYFNKTAAYQKITVDVLDDLIRGSTASTANHQSSGWTFSANSVISSTITAAGFTVTTLASLINSTGITGVAKLNTARTIDGVSFNGTANIHHYCTCSTSAATVAKTASLSGFVLATGAHVDVKFTVTNTASNPTLNINSTGAKSIYYKGAAIGACFLQANKTYHFVYNGSQYELVCDQLTSAPISFSISTSTWSSVSQNGYSFRASITNAAITANDSADVRFDLASIAACQTAQVAPACITYSGGIYIYAKTKPTSTVSGVYLIEKG